MSRRLKVVSIVGTRPNFVKVAPVAAEIRSRGDELDSVLVHTGQHYDDAMSRAFIEELRTGEPDHHLNVGPGTHA